MGAVAISHESFGIPLSICRGLESDLEKDPERLASENGGDGKCRQPSKET